MSVPDWKAALNRFAVVYERPVASRIAHECKEMKLSGQNPAMETVEKQTAFSTVPTAPTANNKSNKSGPTLGRFYIGKDGTEYYEP